MPRDVSRELNDSVIEQATLGEKVAHAFFHAIFLFNRSTSVRDRPVPMFQLNQPSLDLSPEVEAVVSELSTVLDGFELAEWFVTPNQWMRDEHPIAALQHDPKLVYHAARVSRFLVAM